LVNLNIFRTFAKKIKQKTMRFYQEWRGIIWEFNSVGEFLMHLLGRLIGGIIGIGILYLIVLWLAWYGSK
jgi:putative effector of murein hydrolase LrgA (UPF0299 family)